MTAQTQTPTPAQAPPLKKFKAVRLGGFDTLFLVSAVVLAFITIAAIFAPVFAPYDPNEVDFMAVHSGPSAAHWLGTDALGRDLLSRMVYGARTALLGPLLVVVSSTILGI